MTRAFRGRVRKAYPLGEHRALVFDDQYEGDIESGDRLSVDLGGGASATVEVVSLAWGSAFRADSPPLTLVVNGLDDEKVEGAEVRILAEPG
jgi:hypothetical protein